MSNFLAFRRWLRFALLSSVAALLVTLDAAYRVFDAELAVILALVISGVMLGRRALWSVFAILVASCCVALAANTIASTPAHAAVERLPSLAAPLLLITLVLDSHLRSLRQQLTDAAAQQAEIHREIAAREQAQTKLVHARKVEATGHLASGIAHDFNNILDLILGYATQCDRILELDTRQAQDAAIVRVFGAIEGAALRGAAITRKLLAFTRYETARPQRFDAALAIAELQPLLRHLMPRTIELELPVNEGAFFVRFDRNEFDLMVFNIASNARDAMALGGSFRIGLARDGLHVRIAFADTGHGMTQDVLDRVFEPFFSTKAPGKGTGLGLAVIRDIVLACDGNISAASELGEGSTFQVWIPASEAADQVSPDEASAAQESSWEPG